MDRLQVLMIGVVTLGGCSLPGGPDARPATPVAASSEAPTSGATPGPERAGPRRGPIATTRAPRYLPRWTLHDPVRGDGPALVVPTEARAVARPSRVPLAGFEDPLWLAAATPPFPEQTRDDAVHPATLEPPTAADDEETEDAPDDVPGFSDGPRLSRAPGPSRRAHPVFDDGMGAFDDEDEGADKPRRGPGRGDREDQQDTELDRPRAERRGGGGGPTRAQEEDDEDNEEEEFKSDLLINLFGLQDSDYGVFGWLQSSFTGNPGQPRDGTNFGVNPNSTANEFVLQQFYLVFEKRLDPAKGLDFGFRLDNLFGEDWEQYHMTGFLDGAFKTDHYGYEPVQFYGEVHLPVLTEGGIDVKGGRFFALSGYEASQAPARPLNSASYMFSYSHPFTFFGVVSTWHVTDRLNIYNGTVNGWDRWINQNYKWGYIGGFSWDSKDDRTNVSATLTWGPNQFPRYFGKGYKLTPNGVPDPPYLAGRRNILYGSSDQTLLSTVVTHHLTEKLLVVGEADQGFGNHVPGYSPTGGVINAAWYGLGSWLLYEYTEKVTGVFRAEWFRDQGGTRTGFNDNFYEVTVGAILKPYTWFWIRPEIRYDWATGDPAYDKEQKKNQLTLGFDTIFLF